MGAARKLYVADLFCGAGGTSEGLAQVCDELDYKVELLAINHWPVAIENHRKNHPKARHLCAKIQDVDPRVAIPGGHLDLLVASPECRFFSRARGGKPVNDQDRVTAFRILEWIDKLHVSNFLIENVSELEQWGPLNVRTNRPIQSMRGTIFQQFIGMLRAFNYTVDWKVLNAADFGAATTRQRLFIIGRKGNRPVRWPEQTHSKNAGHIGDLFLKKLKPWRAAREIIDWSIPGRSIFFGRKKPLAPNTMERIAAGLKKFCGAAAEPFLVIMRQHMGERSLDKPLPTLTARGNHVALCQPAFILGQQSGSAPRSVKEPLPAVATKGAISVIQPFLVPFYTERQGQTGRGHSVEEPMPTLPCSNKFALIQPEAFILPQNSSNKPRSVKDPAPTLTTTSRGVGLVQPMIVSVSHGGGKARRTHSVDDPLKTVTGSKEYALVQPMIIQTSNRGGNGKYVRFVEAPLYTIVTENQLALVEPCLIEVNHGKKKKGKSDVRGQKLSEPLKTLTTKNGVALIQPQAFIITPGGANLRGGRSTKDPLPTVMGTERFAVVEPFIAKYYGSPKKNLQKVEQPLSTVTTKGRHGLVEPCVSKTLRGKVVRLLLDVRLRMLRPHELSAAMGLTKYSFTGTVEQQVKQIGNMVEVNQAKALIRAIVE